MAFDARADGHEVTVALAVLLHDHDVGAGGQRGAGEDAGGEARRQGRRRVVARGDAIDAAERRGSMRIEVVEAYGIAVDRRIVETGHRHRCGDDNSAVDGYAVRFDD